MANSPEQTNNPTPNPSAPQKDAAGFDPKGTATSTHDVRVQKHEDTKKSNLEPLKGGKAKEIMVSIPANEYAELTKLKDITLLGLEWQEVKLTPQEAEKFEEVIRNENLEKLVVARTTEIKRKAEAEKTAAVKKAVEESEKKAKSKGKSKKAGMVFMMLFAAIIAGAGAWMLKPSRGGAEAIQVASGNALKTVEILPKLQDQALAWVIGNAQHNIMWITNQPGDQRIISKIVERRNKNSQLSVLMVTGLESETLARNISRQTNITTFGLTNSVGPVNWIIIDRTFFVDASTRFGVTLMQDPSKANEIYTWVDQTLGANAKLLYRAR